MCSHPPPPLLRLLLLLGTPSLGHVTQAVYDNDVDYLEVLLDHAVAAQEELQEAKRHAVLNGEIEAPVSGPREKPAWHPQEHLQLIPHSLSARTVDAFRILCPVHTTDDLSVLYISGGTVE